MGMFDKFKKAAEGAVDRHGDKIGRGADRAGEMIDRKTGGKHNHKISGGVDKAKARLDRLDGRDDDIPNKGGRSSPGDQSSPHGNPDTR